MPHLSGILAGQPFILGPSNKRPHVKNLSFLVAPAIVLVPLMQASPLGALLFIAALIAVLVASVWLERKR